MWFVLGGSGYLALLFSGTVPFGVDPIKQAEAVCFPSDPGCLLPRWAPFCASFLPAARLENHLYLVLLDPISTLSGFRCVFSQVDTAIHDKKILSG